jgi:hypothetical protein
MVMAFQEILVLDTGPEHDNATLRNAQGFAQNLGKRQRPAGIDL